MTATDFAAWVAHMKETRGWSERECARRLGCGVNQIARWRSYDAPAYIGLACAAVVANLQPWTRPHA